MPAPKGITPDVKEPQENDQKEVVVEFNEQNEPVKPPAPKEEPKYVRLEDLEKINQQITNTREWNNRKISSLESKFDQWLKAQAAPRPQAPAQTQVAPDEWETKLQKDWKGTVEELSEKKARELYRQMREEENAINAQNIERQRNAQLLENNKSKVLERHKDLMDETSEKANIYREVLQEKPEYLNNPFGPVLAMRDMEDRLREMGHIDEPIQKVVQKEVFRQQRAGASVAPRGTQTTGKNTITLSKEQRELCDVNGWKYEEYAKNMKMLSGNQGVEA